MTCPKFNEHSKCAAIEWKANSKMGEYSTHTIRRNVHRTVQDRASSFAMGDFHSYVITLHSLKVSAAVNKTQNMYQKVYKERPKFRNSQPSVELFMYKKDRSL